MVERERARARAPRAALRTKRGAIGWQCEAIPSFVCALAPQVRSRREAARTCGDLRAGER